MKKYDLTIIIVTFNSGKYIGKCIDSAINSRIDDRKYRIVIIDNNSKDNTVDIILNKQKNKNIYLIKNPKNNGFAKAVNQGILLNKDSNYFLLLNPDTVLKSNSINNLLKCAEINKAGICGGNTYNEEIIENGSYFRFPNLMVGIFDFTNLRKLLINDKWHKYFYYKDQNRNNLKNFTVDVVTGGYMLLSKETIDKIGLFDEKFFMYLEDVDYCLRAKKEKIKIFHTNESKILHIGGASSDNKDRIKHSSWILSRKVYYFKHFNLLTNMIIQPLFIFDDIIILINKYIF